MSNHVVDLTGQKYGRLTIIKRSGLTSGGNVKWLCQCDCGKLKEVASGALRSKTTVSCGCWIREKTSQRSYIHGETKTRLHHIWATMKARCNYIKSISYPNYGGKGIKVCKEWAESYVAFRDWSISHEYADDLTIDRIDSNGNYEPSNCRWTTQYEQNRNRSVNIYATINGETRIIADWCKEFGLNISTVYSRIYHGWGELKALTTPINER